ncbi:hypothetical protein BWQ96_04482 [Gracilariopsis chorda]|uniref:DUF1989 domain-containing protein n=1 Tax=Gracilariopsis chorda TaxID=448386 RepID=A0A2V3IUB2_9FLOR|nr:hypothetical protein BWQ96_04482 [Gracilariopsis chorda]|eukprot:PXF45714.1 hypothetical protein BWQ96_04482 [Gracilariopsis chorda]
MGSKSGSGRLHAGAAGRKFVLHDPVVCYNSGPEQRNALSPDMFDAITELPDSDRTLIESITIPARDARAFNVTAGSICRIEVIEGSQVADLNMWNAQNPREHFYASKTRQIHASHLSVRDSLWSCMPYLRPMATIVKDSISYGIDEDNAGVHDVIGSRCDPYTHFVMTRQSTNHCCHSNLTRSVLPWRLTEHDVHDVFNVFMCTGFTRSTGQYFAKPSPAVKGDHLEFFAHLDLLVAVSACPQGDVSYACGSSEEPYCYPLGVQIFIIPERLLDRYNTPMPSAYSGAHGLSTNK